ncbi:MULTISPECIES: ABC transporter permease [unclassified Mucilaginibacter]|nr:MULTISPECIES: FtsX-like permease family protein [unclassified Mucilaginibacter]MEB0260244.1 FtsX-like permease family protein [Mucilaginibacter sp. 10I4]MEB0300173.1 FtsX-like permease family protein [Mucilaginibacter sp. 5C4]WPX25470.1 FtsX-like permease family protein [Mucilaginibacter sp. 5C4]
MNNAPMDNFNFKRKINFAWLFKMALRDSRRNRSRLLLFISSIVFGIAALVAIYSFRYNIQNDINEQAATLIGADLTISGNKEPDDKLQKVLDKLGDDRSQERSFPSMVLFPKTFSTRLVQVKALAGKFPYYGDLETTPVQAGRSFKTGKYALVDKTLMLQFNAKVGDSVKVGNQTFAIAGVLNKAPGQTGIAASIAPLVYIPMQYLDKTGLITVGSRINYSYYYKFGNKTDVEKLAKGMETQLDKAGFNYDTIEGKKEGTSRSFADLSRFLSLVGFIALLLGCVGVASAINIYIREKIRSIAIMRCMGVKASEAFLIYLIQITGIGLIGSVAGAILGTAIQHLLPLVLKDFLPITISVSISWLAIGQGILLGLIISILFALLPLISIRNISPLNTLRLSFDDTTTIRDPLRWLVYILVVLFITSFAYLQIGNWMGAVFFTIGIAVAFLILTVIAWLLIRFTRVLVMSSWSYIWRQGFANLYRPNNQTIILTVSIGLSTAFIATLFLIQQLLIGQVTLSAGDNQSNMILFDIQTAQQKAVADLTRKQGLPVLSQVPIITMRLEKVNGKTAADAKKDSTLRIAERAYTYEYRVTYRDSITNSEKITSGKWAGKAQPGKDIPVSAEERFAQRINAKVGDKLVFNVQGVMMNTYISSIRKVNWNKVSTNFQVVFPTGVLEDAPQIHVLLTHVPNNTVSAKYQQAVVKQFPNVSIIDLGLILNVLDELLGKIGYVIKFMSGFSIITGIIVLISSVRISKYQRIQESVLLRTLGGSRKQILAITALEYLFLGALSALTGIVIAIGGSWLLAKYTFDMPYAVNFLPVIAIFLIITLLTVIIGLLNSRGILNKPPLEILRSNS